MSSCPLHVPLKCFQHFNCCSHLLLQFLVECSNSEFIVVNHLYNMYLTNMISLPCVCTLNSSTAEVIISPQEMWAPQC